MKTYLAVLGATIIVCGLAFSTQLIQRKTQAQSPTKSNRQFNRTLKPGFTDPQRPSVQNQNRPFNPSTRTNLPSSFGNSNSMPLPKRVSTASRFGLPQNAQNVKNLIRVQYSLPKEAADVLVKFFAIDSSDKIETKITEKKSSSMVLLQVTTDDATQRSVAMFLNSVYSAERIKTIQESKKADTETKASESADKGVDESSSSASENEDDDTKNAFSFYMGILR